MNKLKSNIFNKKSWGSEVTWSLTDSYMAKTVDISKGKRTPLVVHEKKEKSIIVIRGPLYLTYGDCCGEGTVPMYKIPEGWSWYIPPGNLYRYQAIDNPVLLIEVSTPQLEDGITLVDENGIEVAPTVTDVTALMRKEQEDMGKEEKPKKKRRSKKNGS